MTPSERETLLDDIVRYIEASPHWNPKQRNFRLETNPTSDLMYWIIETRWNPNAPYQRLSDQVELNLAKFALKEGQIFEYAKAYFGHQMTSQKRQFVGSPFDEFIAAALSENRPRKSPRKYRHRDALICEIIQKLTIDGVQIFKNPESVGAVSYNNACNLTYDAFEKAKLQNLQMLTVQGINQVWKNFSRRNIFLED